LAKKPFIQTKECISLLLEHYFADTVVMGYTADTEYKPEILFIKKACEEKKIKLFLPLLKLNTEKLIKRYITENIKMIIVAINKNIPEKWLGKIADEKFLNFIEINAKMGKYILKPDFQLLAVKSPLIKKEIKIISSEIIKDKNGSYLKIKKFSFS